ncbi:MAG: hypothetical protein ACREQ1_01830 [Woeseiaceae bacterium]
MSAWTPAEATAAYADGNAVANPAGTTAALEPRKLRLVICCFIVILHSIYRFNSRLKLQAHKARYLWSTAKILV